jgi:hypothetical protein
MTHIILYSWWLSSFSNGFMQKQIMDDILKSHLLVVSIIFNTRKG